MDVVKAHKYSSNHLEAVMKSNFCGCFYCCKTYNPTEIWEWVDGGGTALCPKCGIDSVLPDSKINFNKDFLEKMHDHWFNVSEVINVKSK